MSIDLTKYEGHTPGPWCIGAEESGQAAVDGPNGQEVTGFVLPTDAVLIADAPALLDEIERLRVDLDEAAQTLEAIERALVMRYAPEDILDENSPIREGIRAVLAKHNKA